MARIEGFAEDGFEAVREIFQGFVDDGRETGAGLSIWRDGREVVQLSAGSAGAERPWRADTLVQPYSLSKPFAALAAMVAVKDGALSLDEPIANHWHAYARHGKERTTLRQVLSHQAGQPRFPASAMALGLLDDTALRESLAESPPEYVPGTSLGEHSLTYGHLIDGVLRASTGSSLGEIFTEVVRPALGLDAWFGVPESELHRVADLEYASQDVPRLLPMRPWLAVPPGFLDVARMNSTPWRRSVFGAANLHATASAVAGFFADLNTPDGRTRRLLGQELHAEFLAPQVTGHDEVFDKTITWTLGLIRDEVKIAKGGLGGSVGWWSRRHGHACAYMTRRLADFTRAGEIAAALGDDLSI